MPFYERSKLENGLTVVTEQVPNVRSVALGFWIGVGSRHESDAENGMSHFMEHMLFKGTTTRSAKDISETFESLGAELNAYTTKEFTCFFTRLLDEHLETGVEVLADMLQNPLFNPEHIEFERQVVLEEIAMYEDTPDERIHDLFTAALWPQHPLGRQVLGSTATVETFNPERSNKFFGNHYFPGNIVVAAAGNATHQEVIDLLKEHYRQFATGKTVVNDRRIIPESKLALFYKQTEQVHICYGTAALNARHPDRFALSVLENIIGGGMSSRLFQKIREEKGLAYAVFSYHSLYRETGNLAVYAGTRRANLNEVLKIIEEELQSIVEKGVTTEELDRSREHIKGQLVLGLESTRNRMTRLGKSELTQGEILSIDELVDKVMLVNQDDIKRLAAEILAPERMVLTVIGPVDLDEIKFNAANREVVKA